MGLIDRLSELETPGRRRGKSGNDWGRSLPSFRMKKAVRFWRWPLEKVVVTSPFGKRNGRNHEGVDFDANRGTPIYTVQDGTVVYASSKMKGYGKLIIVRHPSGLFTVYAHNSKMMVSVGKKVKKGDLIGKAGSTGHSTGPHLHFEVRNQGVAVDPLTLYPKDLKAKLAFAK